MTSLSATRRLRSTQGNGKRAQHQLHKERTYDGSGMDTLCHERVNLDSIYEVSLLSPKQVTSVRKTAPCQQLGFPANDRGWRDGGDQRDAAATAAATTVPSSQSPRKRGKRKPSRQLLRHCVREKPFRGRALCSLPQSGSSLFCGHEYRHVVSSAKRLHSIHIWTHKSSSGRCALLSRGSNTHAPPAWRRRRAGAGRFSRNICAPRRLRPLRPVPGAFHRCRRCGFAARLKLAHMQRCSVELHVGEEA